MSGVSRRRFLQLSAATAAGLTLGRPHWAWGESPFGPLQDDPLIRLPEGFSYRIVAETGLPLEGGMGPYPRPNFPDLNVVFPQHGARVLLSTSHEIPPFFPVLTPPPTESYDRAAGGSVTTLLLDGDLKVLEGAYNAGGMFMNCSGSGTPWGTVLTGEETTVSAGNRHGFVWEVDPHGTGKTRLDACGRMEHESAVVGPDGNVYLTEDSGTDSLLYRMVPKEPGKLAAGGILQAYKQTATGGEWVTIEDPSNNPAAQGIAQGATTFSRLEGARFDPLDPAVLYFTETDDPTGCGAIWRLDTATNVLERFAQGVHGGAMCMPDNLAFDAAGNLFVCEDDGSAGPSNPNRILFIDRQGNISVFAELVQTFFLPEPPSPVNIADEPTGPAFWFRPDGSSVLFLNLQRAAPLGGLTLGIQGPFAMRSRGRRRVRRPVPAAAAPVEASALSAGRAWLPSLVWLSTGAAAALVHLRRRGQVEDLPVDLEEVADELGPLSSSPS